MKKQELIHLHGLLAEVRKRYDGRTEAAIDLSGYDSQTTRPTSIHHSKTKHRTAVLELANGLTANMTAEDADPVAPNAD